MSGSSENANDIEKNGEDEILLNIRWSGKDYVVRAIKEDTVLEVKRQICDLTGVFPHRQKLINLKFGSRPAEDTAVLSDLNIKPGLKIMMMGSTEDINSMAATEDTDVIDDFRIEEEETVEIKDRIENQNKLQRRCAMHKMNELNPPREGQKLLVLDIDYTLFDHRSTAENPLELMRPYLHEFLTAAYQNYDIIIWSATSMRWITLKMKELGVLTSESYKITALVDYTAMVTIKSEKHGVFDCKPLGVIWTHYSNFYHPDNTIMFDDLRRNFAMNPQNGLTIRPFRKAHFSRAHDKELLFLKDYLLAIADLHNFSSLNHDKWESYHRHKRRQL